MAVTQDSNSVIKFLAELVARLFSKTPVFFKVIQVISVIVTVVTGLPGLLESVNITLPPALSVLQSKIAAIAGLVSLFISSLPVTTAVSTSGAARTTSEALPFTTGASETPTVTTPAIRK